MCLFVETIRIENRKAENLTFHNERMNRTRNTFFGTCTPIDLANHIHSMDWAKETVKCRVVYNKDITEISYTPYRLRPVCSLHLIPADDLKYDYKSTDRRALEDLYEKRGDADDVLLVQNGLLTDTSIANIALSDGTRWYTPTFPLLKGTRRASLLKEGKITERIIRVEDIFAYSEITLFNAMIPFGKIHFPVDPQHIR